MQPLPWFLQQPATISLSDCSATNLRGSSLSSNIEATGYSKEIKIKWV